MLNKRRALPLGVLAVGLLVVLAGIGIVSGLWSKNLTINGTVQTGDVNADWTGIGACSEFHTWPNLPSGSSDFGEYLGKNVGSNTISIDPADAQILNVSFSNVYPSYALDCELHWQNTGSIPVNFVGYAFDWNAGDTDGDVLHNCQRVETSNQVRLECDEITVVIYNDIGQVDPGDNIGRSFLFHVEQPAKQSDCTASGTGNPWQIDPASLTCSATADYSFRVKLCVAQWNEDPSTTGGAEGDLNACVDSLQHEGPPGGPGDGDGTPYWEDDEDGDLNGVDGGNSCTDGVDNDGDTLIDAADPDCPE